MPNNEMCLYSNTECTWPEVAKRVQWVKYTPMFIYALKLGWHLLAGIFFAMWLRTHFVCIYYSKTSDRWPSEIGTVYNRLDTDWGPKQVNLYCPQCVSCSEVPLYCDLYADMVKGRRNLMLGIPIAVCGYRFYFLHFWANLQKYETLVPTKK